MVDWVCRHLMAYQTRRVAGSQTYMSLKTRSKTAGIAAVHDPFAYFFTNRMMDLHSSPGHQSSSSVPSELVFVWRKYSTSLSDCFRCPEVNFEKLTLDSNQSVQRSTEHWHSQHDHNTKPSALSRQCTWINSPSMVWNLLGQKSHDQHSWVLTCISLHLKL